jgi:hypothetical protein
MKKIQHCDILNVSLFLNAYFQSEFIQIITLILVKRNTYIGKWEILR